MPACSPTTTNCRHGLLDAGLATQEKVWRMPLGAEYDKLIDSKNADMKNIGGRYGGSITAAQFLQRFVKDTPWAHLDIAGTAMGSPLNDISQSWGSGFGVQAARPAGARPLRGVRSVRIRLRSARIGSCLKCSSTT